MAAVSPEDLHRSFAQASRPREGVTDHEEPPAVGLPPRDLRPASLHLDGPALDPGALARSMHRSREPRRGKAGGTAEPGLGCRPARPTG